MIRRPPRSTRTDTLFPYTTLFRSVAEIPQYIVNLAFGRTFTLACRHRHALPEAAVVCRKLRKNLLLARDRQVEHVRGSAIRSRLRQSSASAREPRLPAFSTPAPKLCAQFRGTHSGTEPAGPKQTEEHRG